MKRFLYQYFPLFAVIVIIFFFSSLVIVPGPKFFNNQDKVLHFLAFFALGYTLFRIFSYRSIPFFKGAILVIVLTSLYGLSDEIHQLYVPNREFDWYDLLADFLGSFVSVLIGQKLFKLDRYFASFFFKVNPY